MSDQVVSSGRFTIDPSVRALVDTRQALQRNRIQFGNRVAAIEKDLDNASETTMKMMQFWFETFDGLEDRLDKDVAKLAKGIPIVDELVKLKGIGYMLAAKMVCMIDIERAKTVSALWRYAGYGVDVNGERDRPKKGEKRVFNTRLKTTVFLIGDQFIKQKSPYSALYYAAKEYYQINRPDWTKAHINMASQRKMKKIFLQHLWLVWRTMEGLPTNQPYVASHLGHTHIWLPEDFGWEYRI